MVHQRWKTAAWAALALLPWTVAGWVMVHWGRRWDLDLRVYRDAARALVSGGAPFATRFTGHHLLFTYPPFGLLALCPLALGSRSEVELWWWLLSATALVGVLYLTLQPTLPWPRERVLALAIGLAGVAALVLEPVRSTMDYGQINVLLMLLVVMDVARGTRRRGVLIGVAAAVKLTPLVFLLVFALRRDWRSLHRGILTFVAATAVAWAILPSASASYWFGQLVDTGRIGPIGYVSNQSWQGVLHRVPFHGGWVVTVLGVLLDLATIAVGCSLALRLTTAGRVVEPVLALAIMGLLVSPISWTHHWSWVVLAPVVLFGCWIRTTGRPGRAHRRGVSACMVPLLGVAILAPYWWVEGGALGAVAADALALIGAVVLVAWWLVERRPGVPVGGASPAVTVLSEVNSEPMGGDELVQEPPCTGQSLRATTERCVREESEIG